MTPLFSNLVSFLFGKYYIISVYETCLDYVLKKYIKLIIHTLFFLYKNNIYKNSEPQIWTFERAISENIHPGMQIAARKYSSVPQMHFKHAFWGGSRFEVGENMAKKIRTPSFSQILLVLIKKRPSLARIVYNLAKFEVMF